MKPAKMSSFNVPDRSSVPSAALAAFCATLATAPVVAEERPSPESIVEQLFHGGCETPDCLQFQSEMGPVRIAAARAELSALFRGGMIGVLRPASEHKPPPGRPSRQVNRRRHEPLPRNRAK